MNKKSLVWRDPDDGNRSRPSDSLDIPRRDLEDNPPLDIPPEPRARPRAARPPEDTSMPRSRGSAPPRSREPEYPSSNPPARSTEGHGGPGYRTSRPYDAPPARSRYEDDRPPVRRYPDSGPPPRRYSEGPPPPARERPSYNRYEPYDSRSQSAPAPRPGYDRGPVSRPPERRQPPPYGYDRDYYAPPRDDRYGPPPRSTGARPPVGGRAPYPPRDARPDDRPRYDDRPYGGRPGPAPRGNRAGPPPRGGGPRGSRPPARSNAGKEAALEKLHTEAAEFATNFSIPEAVAFQIVRGDFTLKEWSEKHIEAERKREERDKVMVVKKQQRSRDEGMAQQYFLKQKKIGTPLVFKLYENQSLEGKVISILPYHFWVEMPGDEETPPREKLEKLRVLYCYKQENTAEVTAAAGHDDTVAALNLEPVREKTDRHEVPLDIVGQASQENHAIRVTLNDGTEFEGSIDWHSSYFIKLKVASNASIVVFNHAIRGLQEIAGATEAATTEAVAETTEG